MDHGLFSLVYLDSRARHEGVYTTARDVAVYDHSGMPSSTDDDYVSNLRVLLKTFPRVDVCNSIHSAITKLRSNELSHTYASIVILHIRDEEDDNNDTNSARRLGRSHSPMTKTTSGASTALPSGEIEALQHLQWLTSQHEQQKHHRAIVPVILLGSEATAALSHTSSKPANSDRPVSGVTAWRAHCDTAKFLDAGAVDVLESPLTQARAQALSIQAHRESKRYKRGSSGFGLMPRKTSWVGSHEDKPFAYLREIMVSRLMDRICDPDYPEAPIDPADIVIAPDRRAKIEKAVGTWAFSAHDYNDEELMYGGMVMLAHALSLPELSKWKIPTHEIMTLLMACNRVYNSFVIYHNFRHACDVMQATFSFLMAIGTLPPLHKDSPRPDPNEANPVAGILTPFHALTLLITAIGHDVGHPGVNNLFLVNLNAPLAQLYNDRSVLESFHCAAFSQILRRYWPSTFNNPDMRKLMISCILATDMGLHTQYMTQLGTLDETIRETPDAPAEWTAAETEEKRELLCCLLIKCADICNVARKFPVATNWAMILTEEFANQGKMEKELDMPTCLFGGPPVLNDVVKMGSSQIGFMNIFAGPLFENITKVLPGMRFAAEEIATNRSIWENTVEEAKHKRVSMTSLQKAHPRAYSISIEEQHTRAREAIESLYFTPPGSAQLMQDEHARHSRRMSEALHGGALSVNGRRTSVGVDGMSPPSRYSSERQSINGMTKEEEEEEDEDEVVEQQIEAISGSAGPMSSPELPRKSPDLLHSPPITALPQAAAAQNNNKAQLHTPTASASFKAKSNPDLTREHRTNETITTASDISSSNNDASQAGTGPSAVTTVPSSKHHSSAPSATAASLAAAQVASSSASSNTTNKNQRRFSLKFWKRSRSLGRGERESRNQLSNSSAREPRDRERERGRDRGGAGANLTAPASSSARPPLPSDAPAKLRSRGATLESKSSTALDGSNSTTATGTTNATSTSTSTTETMASIVARTIPGMSNSQNSGAPELSSTQRRFRSGVDLDALGLDPRVMDGPAKEAGANASMTSGTSRSGGQGRGRQR